MENLRSSGVESSSPSVAVVQFAPLLGNVGGNIQQLEALLQGVQADVIVLPELASSGYAFADKAEAIKAAEPLAGSSFISFLTHTAHKKGCSIVSGFNELDGSSLYNTAVLVTASGLVGKYRKIHLFWNEVDLFEPGDVGLPVFDIGSLRLGILICFDWMFPEVWRILALKGADLIAHPSNLVLPYCQQAVAVHALCNRVYVATANRIGTERNLTFTGGSLVASPLGEKVIEAPVNGSFSASCSMDLSLTREKKITPRNTLAESRRPDCYSLLTKHLE